MNSRFAVLALAILAGVAYPQEQGLLLRRQLQEGATEKYSLEMQMTTNVEMPSGLGEQEMSMNTSADMVLKFGKMNWQIPAANVEATTTVRKLQVEGILQGAIGKELPPPTTVKIAIDPLGAVRGSQAQSADAFELSAMSNMSWTTLGIVLPEKPVNIGDSWQVLIPKGGLTQKNQYLTATLKGEKEACWVIGVSGKYDLAVQSRSIPSPSGMQNPLAGQKMSLKGSVEVDGEGLVQKSTGRTAIMHSVMKTMQKATIASFGMEINSDSRIVIDVKLLD